MLTANEVAKNVSKPDFPNFKYGKATVAKYQRMILEALGVSGIEDWYHANNVFAALGIDAESKRVGRKSVPVITILPRNQIKSEGGWNPGGDGDAVTWTETLPDVDFSAIEQWVVS